MSTNGWGKGSVNNSNGWGAGAINNDNGWGDSQLKSWSGDTDIDGGTGIPVNTLAPVISGGDTVGSTLTSTTGTWTGTPEPTFTFKWFRDSNEIVGATSNTYTLVDEDAETVIRSRVTATNIFGSDIKDSNIINVLPTTDPDAQAFITAASITNPTQQSAINTLVTDLKGYGIWSKMKALYPFVGGTASSHKFNLKDPRDLDAAFRLVFNGGWTHSSTGALPNGTNGYADTFFRVTPTNSFNRSFGIYYRNVTNTSSSGWIGAYNAYNAAFGFQLVLNNGQPSIIADGMNRLEAGPANIISKGLISSVIESNTNAKIYNNSSVVIRNTNAPLSKPDENIKMYLGALNNNNNLAAFFGIYELAFSYLGDGLTSLEHSNFYTAVQNFQVSLNRQV